MTKLQSAGLLNQIISFFFPKQLTAEVRAEVLPSGQVAVTPVFMIDGHEVPSELVGEGPTQTILGYRVKPARSSLQVHEKTRAKRTVLSKSKAPDFLEELEKFNIPIRSRDGKARPRIARVKPEVTLTLRSDDSLVVEPALVSTGGVILRNPSDLEQLKKDEGWYADGDDLIRVTTTDTPLDSVLISPGESTTLTGSEVPKFLKLLQTHPKAVADVERNQPLQSLSVFGENTENRAKVDGDSESITISPVLVFHGPKGKPYEATSDGLKSFENDGGFTRVPEGWIEVSKEVAQGHRWACRDLTETIGDLTDIRGSDIPKTLVSLARATQKDQGWRTPWTVYFSQAVEDSHRIVATPATVEFRLNIVESDGHSLLELDPIYNHERFQLSYGETETAIVEAEGWSRRRDAWIWVDVDKRIRSAEPS